MLHTDTYARNGNPAHKAEQNRLSACFTSFIMSVLRPIAAIAITIKNLLSCFKKPKMSLATSSAAPLQTESYNCCNYRRQHKVEDKHRKNLFKAYLFARAAACGNFFLFSKPYKSKNKRNRNNRKRSCKLNYCRIVKHGAVGWWSESQVEAAAVTDEVSLIAVPANKPKPSFVIPRKPPSVGKISAAITLKRKITEIDWAISSSSASITGAVAQLPNRRRYLNLRR